MNEPPKKKTAAQLQQEREELVTFIFLTVFMILWVAAGPPRLP